MSEKCSRYKSQGQRAIVPIKGGEADSSSGFSAAACTEQQENSAFIDTVLLNFPFPEVYVAAGEVDVQTGEGKDLLVDGQHVSRRCASIS